MQHDLIVSGQRLPMANGPCLNCLSSKLPKVTHPQSITIYCEHNQAAAVMHRRNGHLTEQWVVITPISAGEWTDRLSNGQLP